MFSQSEERNKRHTSVDDVMLAVYSMHEDLSHASFMECSLLKSLHDTALIGPDTCPFFAFSFSFAHVFLLMCYSFKVHVFLLMCYSFKVYVHNLCHHRFSSESTNCMVVFS